MSYVDKQLTDGERVTYRTTLHPIIFLGPALTTGLGVPFFFMDGVESLGAILVMVGGLAFLGTRIRYSTSEFAVTDKRVLVKTGFISRKTMDTMLTKVEGVQVDQTIGGRIFNYGSVTVTGTGGSKEPFKMIRYPMILRQRVQEGSSATHAQAVEGHLKALQVGGAASVEPREDDVVTRLERLAKLRESGALTQEEFEREKGKVLG